MADIVKRYNCLQMAENKNEPTAPSSGQILTEEEETNLS